MTDLETTTTGGRTRAPVSEQWHGLADEYEVLPSPELAAELRRYWARAQGEASALVKRAEAAGASGTEEGRREQDFILRNIAREHLPEHIVRRHQSSMRMGSSFQAEMAKQYQVAKAVLQHGGHSPGNVVLTQKSLGQRFARRLGLPVPELLSRSAPLSELVLQADTVIKPVRGSGSTGVFIVNAEDDIFEVRQNKRHRSFDSMLKRAAKLETKLGVDRWQVEQLLRSPTGSIPPSDLKFYTFYGQVGLVLEVDRSDGSLYCWYDRSGQLVETGKYSDKLFHGSGFPEGSIEEIEEVSLKIPTPFMRIDTFLTDNGLVYGEFTARPGGYDQFSLAADRLLGDMFVQAEARLYADMIARKHYPEYVSHAESWLTRRDKARARGGAT